MAKAIRRRPAKAKHSAKARRPIKAKRSTKPKGTRAHALEQNHKAIVRHTHELTRNSAALAAHTRTLVHVNARQLVYSVLQEPVTLPDSTQLSALGLDFPALAGTAAEIRARGVNVDTGAVQACKTIKDLINVVAAA